MNTLCHYLGGSMELRMSSVCEVGRSNASFFSRRRLLASVEVLTSIGVLYLTRELWDSMFASCRLTNRYCFWIVVCLS